MKLKKCKDRNMKKQIQKLNLAYPCLIQNET